MKNLKDLNGVKILSKTQQKSISGGIPQCLSGYVWCALLKKCVLIGTCSYPIE
jgi:hypothetical protein